MGASLSTLDDALLSYHWHRSPSQQAPKIGLGAVDDGGRTGRRANGDSHLQRGLRKLGVAKSSHGVVNSIRVVPVSYFVKAAHPGF
jgi:hypothetical protein